MEKKFDEWNIEKKKLDASDTAVDFHEREIWWCSIGINIGSEQHSQSSDFSRPVLVVRKFTRNVFWGIPLTTQTKELNFRIRLKLGDADNDLLVLQMRAYDGKRLIRKITTIPKPDYKKIKDVIRMLLRVYYKKTNPA